jgi:hypothetical protein
MHGIPIQGIGTGRDRSGRYLLKPKRHLEVDVAVSTRGERTSRQRIRSGEQRRIELINRFPETCVPE